ncbi:MAG: hypothetical protein K2H40_08150 [Lachnospiraceae bacterium]|nr:hypothetical protein [Lachnospiraceae bacterium]
MVVQLYGEKHHKTVIQNKYAAEHDEQGQKKGGNDSLQNGLSINVRGESDAVLMRKQIAKKRAKKAIEDAWSGDRKIAADVEKRKEHLQEVRDDISRRTGYIMAYEEKKAQLKEEYAIDEDSEAYKKLLEKREQSLVNPEVVLTQAEKERLAEIDEYEARLREMDVTIHEFQTERVTGLRTLESVEDVEIASIAAIHMEQTKFDEMLKAQKAAGKIEAAAGENVFDMLVDEAKEHINETLEKKREEAKEKAEKEGKEEERIEAQRAAKEIQQRQFELEPTESRETEAARIEQEKNAREQEDILAEVEKSSTGTASTSSQTRIEIKQMLHKMNLLEEDLKGLEVDDSI